MPASRALIFVMLFAITVTNPAAAQDFAGRFAITPQAGIVVPVGDFAASGETFADNRAMTGFAETGFTAGGTLEYYFTEEIAGGLDFYYNRFYVDDQIFDEVALPMVGAHYRVIEAGVHLKYLIRPRSSVRPYGKATLMLAKPHGMASVDFGTNADTEIMFDATWGFEFAAGVNIRKSRKISYIVEAGFTQLATKGKTIEAGLAGLAADGEMNFNTQWFTVRAGVVIFLNSW